MADWGQGFQGAAGGAMAGGAVGGPLGAGIGGILGGLGGLFGGSGKSGYEDQLRKLAQGYGSRTAPQMGPAAQSAQSSLVNNRTALIAQLEAMARGEGPSAAAAQMKAGMDRAAAGQASAAAGAGGRGVNSGAALRNATNQSAAINAQGNQDMGALRANEQANAVQQLGTNIGYGIQADNQNNQFNANEQNQGSQANLQALLQTMNLNDRAQLEALLGAIGVTPQGMGTSILAGGAGAVPGILAMKGAGQQQMGKPGYPQWGHTTGPTQNPNFGQSPTPNGNGLGSGQQNPWG